MYDRVRRGERKKAEEAAKAEETVEEFMESE